MVYNEKRVLIITAVLVLVAAMCIGVYAVANNMSKPQDGPDQADTTAAETEAPETEVLTTTAEPETEEPLNELTINTEFLSNIGKTYAELSVKYGRPVKLVSPSGGLGYVFENSNGASFIWNSGNRYLWI